MDRLFATVVTLIGFILLVLTLGWGPAFAILVFAWGCRLETAAPPYEPSPGPEWRR